MADRWHLLKNTTEAFQQVLERKHPSGAKPLNGCPEQQKSRAGSERQWDAVLATVIKTLAEVARSGCKELTFPGRQTNDFQGWNPKRARRSPSWRRRWRCSGRPRNWPAVSVGVRRRLTPSRQYVPARWAVSFYK